MALKSAIRKGDTTTHGGTVLEGMEEMPIFDKPVACKGHMVYCPKCDGTYPILDGTASMPIGEAGREPAVEGMKTACGAVLIASQDMFQMDVPDGFAGRKGKKYALQFLLADKEDNPMPNMPYRIMLGETVYATGTTDADGRTEEMGEDEGLDLNAQVDVDSLIGGL